MKNGDNLYFTKVARRMTVDKLSAFSQQRVSYYESASSGKLYLQKCVSVSHNNSIITLSSCVPLLPLSPCFLTLCIFLF